MNNTNVTTTTEPSLIESVSDVDMLKYLIKENGKTKEEIATEIRERFWTYKELQHFFEKP